MATVTLVFLVMLGVVLGAYPSSASSACTLLKIQQCEKRYTTHDKKCVDYQKVNDCINGFLDQCITIVKRVGEIKIARNDYSKKVCPAIDDTSTCWDYEISRCIENVYLDDYGDMKEKYNEMICKPIIKNTKAAVACMKAINTTCNHRRVISQANLLTSFITNDLVACQSGLYFGDKCLAKDIDKCDPVVDVSLSVTEYFAERCRKLDSSIKCLDKLVSDCSSDEQKRYHRTKKGYLKEEEKLCQKSP